MGGPPDVGPQNPAVDKQGSENPGVSWEVFSVDDDGRRRRHQLWRDKAKAYDQMRELKKLYGADMKVGIREVRDFKGNLFQQVVRKAAASVSKSHRRQEDSPVEKWTSFESVVAACADRLVKAEGWGNLEIGKTPSGKCVYGSAAHQGHHGFDSDDHKTAARLQENLARNAERAARNAQVQGHRKDDQTYTRKFMFHDRQAAAHRKAAEQIDGKKKEYAWDRINEISGKDRLHIRPTN